MTLYKVNARIDVTLYVSAPTPEVAEAEAECTCDGASDGYDVDLVTITDVVEVYSATDVEP